MERVHPEDRAVVKKVVQRALRKRQPMVSHDCRIVRPDGSIRTIHGLGEVILDDTGKLMSMIGTAHDVTKYRQLDEERARLAQKVESSNDAIFSVSLDDINRQFHQLNLVEGTTRILAETRLNHQFLEFDVTEQTIMEDIAFSMRSMQALTEMDVTLAIDNFGCGSSSLHWIKKMPTHRIEIDKSFIQNMLNEPDDLAVVNAVIAMSHNLQMEVVANGVETEEQLAVIRQSGCDQLQGYAISAPLSPAEFERMAANY